LHKFVLFYWHANNCVGSALADDRGERCYRDSRPELPRVMRAYRRGFVPILRPELEESLLEEPEPGVSTLAHTA